MVKKDGMILENTSLKLYLTSKNISHAKVTEHLLQGKEQRLNESGKI